MKKTNNIKIIAAAIISMLAVCARAQFFTVLPGTGFKIMAGTYFKADSLTLIPSDTFTLSDISINKSATVAHTTVNAYISRVYRFSNNTVPFSGAIQINYQDGAELNNIPESGLNLNINNDTAWTMYTVTTRDATNNFVFTTSLSGVTLNELALADPFLALPLQWLSFTATRQNEKVLLQWTIAQEQNTRDFTVQHSANGKNWAVIGILPATGNSSTVSQYSYLHNNPVNGINYYRIIQTDLDGLYRYSEVRTVKFTKANDPFVVLGNPVTTGTLSLQIGAATNLALYTADGKLVWMEKAEPGIKTVDVSRFAKGIYFLRDDAHTMEIVIQ